MNSTNSIIRSSSGADPVTGAYGSINFRGEQRGNTDVNDAEGDAEHHQQQPDLGLRRPSFSESVASLLSSGRHTSVLDVGGTASISSVIVNLIKNVVGAGMLALPSGIAAYGNAPSAILPGIAWTIVAGLILGYYFVLIGRVCRLTYSATYRGAWTQSMGNRGSFLVALVNMIKPAIANLMYSMILADTSRSLFSSMGLTLSRSVSLIVVTVIALLPLCMLKNLNALAPFSVIGSLSLFSTAGVCMIRYFDGSYDPSRNGRFLKDLADDKQPSFGTTGAEGAFHPQVMILICLLFEAYVAHYNAPRFYTELQRNTIPRFTTVVLFSFGASCFVFILVATFGFLTFGGNCDGYILNNYSDQDGLVNYCRIAIFVAMLFTYPVTFLGARDGVLDVFGIPMERQTSVLLNIISVVLLAIITGIAMIVYDLGLVNAIGGGTMAVVVVFVFPTVMFRGVVMDSVGFGSLSLDEDREGDDVEHIGDFENDALLTKNRVREVYLAMAMMIIGVGVGITGVFLAVQKVEEKA